MYTDLLVNWIKTDNFYIDISEDVESRIDTLGYLDRPLPMEGGVGIRK